MLPPLAPRARFAATLAVLSLAFVSPAARASIAYGSINNFDTVNDTGHVCHGFEIEIEECRSTDITYTYDYNHYGAPLISQDDSLAGHPKCLIRWASKKNPDGSWAAHTAVPSGPIAPTDGHMFTDPSVNFGGEHFGVGFSVMVGAIRYHWLIDDGSGALIHGGAVQVSTPAFTYFPPAAAPAQVQAVIAPPPPPAPELKEFGKALWVKEIRTTSHNSREVRLRELVTDDPQDPNDLNWTNGEPDEIEVEWQLLQKDYHKGDGGPNNEIAAAPEDLPNNDEVVTRRYEFFKYVGPLDNETGEAMADAVDPDGIHGVGQKIINGVNVDLTAVEVVGDFAGSQMAAVDVDAPVGLIDHVNDAEQDVPYAPRSLVIQGVNPFAAMQTGELPPGMTFDEVTGVLSGTPTSSGVYQFTVTASDGINPEVSKNYTLQVAAAGLPLPPASLVDTSVSPPGAGTTSGDGAFAVGAAAVITATAADGFVFSNWTDNGQIVSSSPSYTVNLDVNHSLVANFLPQSEAYTIATGSMPAGGGSTAGGGSVASGANVTVVATPSAGYGFVNWTEGGTPVSSNASYSFTASANRTLVANFILQGGTMRTISTSSSPAGAGTTSGAGSYADGTEATVTATANPGYKFAKWKQGGASVSTSASYTFPVSADRALVAVFEPVLIVTTSSAPANGGTTEADSNGYKAGENATVKAFPNPGYAFLRWTENGNQLSTDAQYTFTVTANRNLVAQFGIPGALAISTAASPAAGGSTTGGGSYLAGDSVTVAATAAAGYGFVNWTEGGVPVSANPSYAFTASTSRSLVANFTAGHTISAAADPVGSGIVSGGGFVPAGASITLTATANAGYAFVHWVDSLGAEVSPDPTFTFTPTADGAYTAQFSAATGTGIVFDFDTGTPLLNVDQPLPFGQVSSGYTASLSSPTATDFQVATEADRGETLSLFAGHYVEAITDGATLVIQFDQPVTGASIDFATVEPVTVPVASTLQLTAVDNSTGTPLEAGIAIAHGSVAAGDSLPSGTLAFNSSSGTFDEIRLQLPNAPGGANRFLVDNLRISPASSTGGSLQLVNPNWNITLTDFGYSDFLLDNTPGFEGREYLSGEWGSAVAYTRNGQTRQPAWLEPRFLFPDWSTNSDFHVVTPIHLTGTNLDGLPIAESVIANNDLQILLRFEMMDTVTGTPMGQTPASAGSPARSINSNRYVMNQSFTVTNVSADPITGLQLFQLLHGYNSQSGQYDNRTYPGKLAEYQYDVTMAGLDTGAAGNQSSSAGVIDLIGFQSKIAPSAFEIGQYGIEGNGLDDHSMGKPSDGVHLSIEDNWQSPAYLARKNRDSFAPASRWIGGAQRWDLGSLAPGQSITFDLVLSLLTGTKVVVTGGGGGSTQGGGSCNGGTSHVGGIDFEFEDIDQEGTFFGEFSEADDDEMLEREQEGEFALPSFETPAGTRRQVWNLNYNGSHTGNIRLRFAYDPAKLPANYDENQLSIYHFRNGNWEKLPCIVNPGSNTIEAVTPSLSPFMLGINDVVVRPTVEMSQSSPGTLAVSWPDSFTGWTLQESADLVTWANSARVIGNDAATGTNFIAVPVASGVKFFRLLRP